MLVKLLTVSFLSLGLATSALAQSSGDAGNNQGAGGANSNQSGDAAEQSGSGSTGSLDCETKKEAGGTTSSSTEEAKNPNC